MQDDPSGFPFRVLNKKPSSTTPQSSYQAAARIPSTSRRQEKLRAQSKNTSTIYKKPHTVGLEVSAAGEKLLAVKKK
jgi:hypothetical protein